MNIFTIDNFFEGEFTVDQVREFGLSQFVDKNLITDGEQTYPGIRSQSLHIIHPKLHNYILNKIMPPAYELCNFNQITAKKSVDYIFYTI